MVFRTLALIGLVTIASVSFAAEHDSTPKEAAPKSSMSSSAVDRLKFFVDQACSIRRAGTPIVASPATPNPGPRGECDLLPTPDKGTLGGSGEINGWYWNKETRQCVATLDLGTAGPRGPFGTRKDCAAAVAAGKCAPVVANR